MTPLPVVKDLDIFLNRCLGMSARFVMLAMCQFVFQAAPEDFHRRVIVAVSLTGHESLHVKLVQQLAIVMSTMLPEFKR